MSVAVQYMVDARVAGVMFTLNPVTGDPSSIAIDASYGLGVTVVGGEVTPDSFLVSKVTRELMRSEIGAKEIECVADHERGGDDDTRDVDAERRATALPRAGEEIGRSPSSAAAVERHYGRRAGPRVGDRRRLGEIFLLQTRPETVWAQKRTARPSPPTPTRGDRRHVHAAGSDAVSDGSELTPEDVKEILRLVDESGFEELELETPRFTVRFRAGATGAQERGEAEPSTAGRGRGPPRRGDGPDGGHGLPRARAGRAAFRRGRQPRSTAATQLCIIEVMKLMSSRRRRRQRHDRRGLLRERATRCSTETCSSASGPR